MTTNGTTSIERCRYGATAVWLARGPLGGSEARRLADRVHHHFRAGERELVLDVRGLELVDTCGVGALARCREAHPRFRIVGRPLGWADLPLRLRLGVARLAAGPDLASALETADADAPVDVPAGADLRRHLRVPVGIPVEIILDGRTAPATLEDISRSGLRLGGLAAETAAALAGFPGPGFAVLGLGADPFAREVLGTAAAGAVPAVPVHLLPDSRVGARFAESRPPS